MIKNCRQIQIVCPEGTRTDKDGRGNEGNAEEARSPVNNDLCTGSSVRTNGSPSCKMLQEKLGQHRNSLYYLYRFFFNLKLFQNKKFILQNVKTPSMHDSERTSGCGRAEAGAGRRASGAHREVHGVRTTPLTGVCALCASPSCHGRVSGRDPDGRLPPALWQGPCLRGSGSEGLHRGQSRAVPLCYVKAQPVKKTPLILSHRPLELVLRTLWVSGVC